MKHFKNNRWLAVVLSITMTLCLLTGCQSDTSASSISSMPDNGSASNTVVSSVISSDIPENEDDAIIPGNTDEATVPNEVRPNEPEAPNDISGNEGSLDADLPKDDGSDAETTDAPSSGTSNNNGQQQSPDSSSDDSSSHSYIVKLPNEGGVTVVQMADIKTGISWDGVSPIIYTYADGTTGTELKDGATYEYLPGMYKTYTIPRDYIGREIGSTCDTCGKIVAASITKGIYCVQKSYSFICEQCGVRVAAYTCHTCDDYTPSKSYCHVCGRMRGDGAGDTCVRWMTGGNHTCSNCGATVPGGTCHNCAEYRAGGHTHVWVSFNKTVWHDEVGHYETVITEAWDEPVYEKKLACDSCDALFDSASEAGEHSQLVHYFQSSCGVVEVQTGTIHHDEVVEEVWVVDQAGYNETVVGGYKCTVCGETKGA